MAYRYDIAATILTIKAAGLQKSGLLMSEQKLVYQEFLQNTKKEKDIHKATLEIDSFVKYFEYFLFKQLINICKSINSEIMRADRLKR